MYEMEAVFQFEQKFNYTFQQQVNIFSKYTNLGIPFDERYYLLVIYKY